jgi:RHS repeat-associated protein
LVTGIRPSSEGTRAYSYDARGDLTGVALPSDGENHTSYSCDAAGQLTSASLPDGSRAGYSYDLNGLVTSIDTTLPTGNLHSTYDRNASGVITAENSNRYDYDNLGRLTGWYSPATDATTTYSYDGASNLVTVSRPGTGTLSYSYDDANRITNAGFTYDGRGNLTSDGTRCFTYDAENRLATVTSAATSATLAAYTYEAYNRRMSSTEGFQTTYYHYQGASPDVIAETDGSGDTVASYSYGAGNRLLSMTRGGQTYYYHTNARGDVIALTDASGNIVDSYAYDPWGNQLSVAEAVPNPYRYAGYRFDEVSGLYYCWNRDYSPGIARFLERDLIPGQITSPRSLNNYAYCADDPVNLIDPSGLCPGSAADYWQSYSEYWAGQAASEGWWAYFWGGCEQAVINVGVVDAAVGVVVISVGGPEIGAWLIANGWGWLIGAGGGIAAAAIADDGIPGAVNVTEQLAARQALSNPTAGIKILEQGDPKYLAAAGWEKMAQNIVTSQGRVEVHYFYNWITGEVAQGKVIH